MLDQEHELGGVAPEAKVPRPEPSVDGRGLPSSPYQFFIKRPFDGDAALVGYLTFFALIGVAGFFCTELLPLRRRRRYRISRVERLASATVIEARPAGRPIRLRPGQFAFLSIARAGLREPPPFTIAGRDATVRFAIKASGDFTEALRRDISINDFVRIEGGYGRFDYARGGLYILTTQAAGKSALSCLGPT